MNQKVGILAFTHWRNRNFCLSDGRLSFDSGVQPVVHYITPKLLEQVALSRHRIAVGT